MARLEDNIVQEEALELVPPFERAIPGQSLTNDPDSPLPFEGQPEFTSVQEALGFLLNNMLEPAMVQQVIESLSKGVAVTELAYMILYEGFRTGRWNPDLMLLLAEPLMYILLYIAERADIGNVKIYSEEENEEFDDLEGPEKLQTMSASQRAIKEYSQLKNIDKSIPNLQAVLPAEITTQIEEATPPSLLEQPQGE